MKTLVIFILIFTSPFLYGKERSIRLSLRQAVDMALRKNPDIRLVELKIKKTELDIEQRFIDIRESKLKGLGKRLAILELENQRDDIIDTVEYDVQEKFYNTLLSKIRYQIALEDLGYTKSYWQEGTRNYRDGKIDEESYEEIKEEYRQKEEELVLSEGDYKRSSLFLLLSINISLANSVHLTDSIRENLKALDFGYARGNLRTDNRQIRQARLKYRQKRLEYRLTDKEVESKNDIRRAKFDYKESKIELKQVIRKQVVELWSRYLRVKELEANRMVAQKRMNRRKRTYENSLSRFKQGYTSRNTQDRSLISYKRERYNYFKVVKDLNLAKLRYFSLLR